MADFVLKYADGRGQIHHQVATAASEKELRGIGLIPTFAHRSLDGTDPTAPRADDAKQWGTPEWIATNCKDKPHW